MEISMILVGSCMGGFLKGGSGVSVFSVVTPAKAGVH